MPRSLPSFPAAALIAAVLACNSDNLSAPTTGTLEVTTATAGVETDGSGYTIQVDDLPPRSVGPSTAIWITGLSSAEHTVSLGGVAANCSVQGQNPQTVELPAGDTTAVTFSVSCVPSTGQVIVRSSTNGSFPDPDGYTIKLDGAGRSGLGPQSVSTIPGLAPRIYLVELGGVAANCGVEGPNPRSVEVSAGATTSVGFHVDCSEAPPIAFVSDALVHGMITLVNPDGTGLIGLVPPGYGEFFPTWSPDRSKIAFQSTGDLFVMNSDGTGRTRLTNGFWIRQGFRWAPDGGSLVAMVFDCKYTPDDCLGSHLWIIRADGSGTTLLAQGSWPSWSPDGRTIAFVNDHGIYTVNPDGSGLTRLQTPLGAHSPVWSPDGSRIAFSSLSAAGVLEILVMNRDGSELVNVTQGRGYDREMVWSPDGSKIAFTTGELFIGQRSRIGVSNADGTGRVLLTDNPSGDRGPAWSPDGRQIAFVRDEFPPRIDTEIYVIDAEGGPPTNVSNSPEIITDNPVWSSK